MTIYKVSYVVPGDLESGAIIRQTTAPKIGEKFYLDGKEYKITEIIKLIPPVDNVEFLHVTLEPVSENAHLVK